MTAHQQRGAALVVAMLVFALAAALLVAMQKEFTLFLKRGSNLMVREQAVAYLRGGEELAILVLREDWRTDREGEAFRDGPKDIWAEQVAPYALDEGGWLIGKLQDLQGRFHLANLLSVSGNGGGDDGKKPRFTASQQQFIRLLQALPEVEVSEREAISITESVVDWLDPDTDPRDNGAEDGLYYDRSPSYRVANALMGSVSELRSIANMTPEIFSVLAPLVTVWGEFRTININMAPVEVLRSINADQDLSPLSVADGQALVEERGEEGFADLDSFWASPVFADLNLTNGVKSNFGEETRMFLFSGEVEVAERVVRLYSVLHRSQETGKVRALVRASGSL